MQFGEGGAGTFSDGKLWSQISDPRHLTRKVLTEFVKAGAPEEILYVAKPHIGTFRLVGMVEKMRAEIESLGGEVRFEQKRDRSADRVGPDPRTVTVANPEHPQGEELAADHVVLALGHSARDTFAMLYERGVFMEAKPFSIGFRIEHPQSVIDRARFGPNAGHPRARCGRLQAGASRRQRPLGVQLLHVSRAARWSRRRPSPGTSSRTA